MTLPCPFCQLTGGFHDEGVHSDLRGLIPREKVRPSNNEVRRVAKGAR